VAQRSCDGRVVALQVRAKVTAEKVTYNPSVKTYGFASSPYTGEPGETGDTILKHRHPPLESMAVDVVVLKYARRCAESENLPPIAYGREVRIGVPW